MSRAWGATLAGICVLAPSVALAHLGSPDVFYGGPLGEVTIRRPDVVPGLAQIELHTADKDLKVVALALPLDREHSAHSPAPDPLTPSPTDPQDFTGQVWLMSTGSWQVRIAAYNDRGGVGELELPVPALPTRVTTMPLGIGALLAALLALLLAGMVGIVGASVREGQLDAGVAPEPARTKRARVAMAIGAAVALAVVVLGGRWWASSHAAYAKSIYRPLEMSAQLETDGSLSLKLRDPGWLKWRKLDDFIAKQGDRGHLMSLSVVSLPGLENFAELHPEQVAPGAFHSGFPRLPAGRYELVADVVHDNGLPETLVAELAVPAGAGDGRLGPDDSAGEAPPVGKASEIDLREGRHLRLSGAPLVAGKLQWLRFRVEEDPLPPCVPPPQSPHDVSTNCLSARVASPPITAGEAEVVSEDGAVFARLTPSGSIPPAALALANPDAPPALQVSKTEIAFPYGFPRSGRYRVLVQVQRAGHMDSGAVDVEVR